MKAQRSVSQAAARSKATKSERFRLSVSRARHDLNNALGQILGFSELLLEEPGEPGREQLRDELQFVRRTASQLISRINEGLAASRIEGGLTGLAQLQQQVCEQSTQLVSAASGLTRKAETLPDDAFKSDLSRIDSAAQRTLELARTSLASLREPVAVRTGSGRIPPAGHPPADRLRRQAEPETRVTGRKEGMILVVDDMEENRALLSRLLSRLGYSVRLVDSGQRALDFIGPNPVDLILLDIVMPGLDGIEVLQRLKRNPATEHIPVVMLSSADQLDTVVRCIKLGADDFLPKPFNTTLLMARIESSLSKKRLRDQEHRTYEALQRSQKHLAGELTKAAGYVRSLLPPPLTGPIETEWCFQPSEQLGGDAFGYHWIDGDHLAIYLLDVCGHGVGAALLSVSVLNALRAHTLPGVDFRRPEKVLAALNRAFWMENQNSLYFTLWYGVYRPAKRQFGFASGGHPPALLVTTTQAKAPMITPLGTNGPAVGCLEDATFSAAVQPIAEGARLLLFSDGIFEIFKPGEAVGTWDEFVKELARPEILALRPQERLRRAREMRGATALEDDFSLVEVRFR